MYLCFVSSYYFFACVGNLAERSAQSGSLHGEVEQIALAGAHALGDSRESLFDLSLVAMALDFVEPFDLLLAHFGIVDLEDVDRILVVESVLVDTDDGLATGVDTRLCARSGSLDTELGQSGFDSLGHAAELFDLLDVLPCAVCDLVGERLHVV